MFPLPIDEILSDLINALSTHTQILLKAPPGAGKSTRVPQFLLDKGLFTGKIILLEPRRLAARNIAEFLASLYGEEVGNTVGLRMRGETRVSEKTRLEIVTEGVLTRMLQNDPELLGVDVVIFDEFHERNLQADLALALTLDMQSGLREDLRVIIMSATLNDHALSAFLPDAKILISEGRSFPVDLRYHPISRIAYPDEAISGVIMALLEKEKGSILVFLPGVAEIKRIEKSLLKKIQGGVIVQPLYGQLSLSAQKEAIRLAPLGERKVVLATNIAETSLTIEGIRLVVDSGFERVAHFNRKTGISKLETRQIARSSAIQRMGRAGRLCEGVCVRLYSEETYQRMQAAPEPEIRTSDLMSLAFEVIQWGCLPSDLHWLDMPLTADYLQGIKLLNHLEIIDEKEMLTQKGKWVAALGMDVRLGAMLHFAEGFGDAVFSLGCWLAAWSEDPPRSRELDLKKQLEDLVSHKRNSRYFRRAKHLALKRKVVLSDSLSWSFLGLLAASAWPDRIAKSRGRAGRFLLSNGHGAQLDIEDPLSAHESLVALDLVRTSQGDSRIYCACLFDFDDIYQHMPTLFHSKNWIDWDEKKGTWRAEHQICLGEIVFKRTRITEVDETLRRQALLKFIRRNGLACLSLTPKVRNLMLRAQCAKEWGIALSLPSMDEASLLDELDDWLLPFMLDCPDIASVKKLDLYRAFEARLGWEAFKALDVLLPVTYQVASGAHYKIRYQLNQKPVLAVKMQEMYGQSDLPTIAQGKVVLVLELLSPALRPLQITQDLVGFWEGAYKDVQKEMKGRYPKHVWPDDPANYHSTMPTKPR